MRTINLAAHDSQGSEAEIPLTVMSTDEKKTLLETAETSNFQASLSGQRPRPAYKLYPARFVILAVLALLNTSNGMLWITFAAIAPSVKSFYSLDSDLLVNLLSLIFFVVCIPGGFVGAWVLDTWGLRTGLLVGAWLNGVGAIVRYFSAFGHHYYSVLMTGQILCAAAQPFILFAPTKLTALWFGETERATANMVASIANPVGIAIATAVSPHLSSPSRMDVLWVYAIPAGAGVIMTTIVFCIWGSKPKTPPSTSASDEKTSFWKGLRQFWKFKWYVMLMIGWGFGVGLFNALQTFIEQLVCTRGYSEGFAGLCGALLILFGIPGALIAGIIVDHTRKYKEIMKVSYVFATGALIWFTAAIRYENEEVQIAAAMSVFGFFALAMLPVSMELSVECTFPHMSEATAAGLLWTMGQIMGIILVFIGQVPGLVTQLNQIHAPNNTCSSKPNPTISTTTRMTPTPSTAQDTVSDMINYSWMLCGITAFLAIGTILFFWPHYRRIEREYEVSVMTNESSEGVDDTVN